MDPTARTSLRGDPPSQKKVLYGDENGGAPLTPKGGGRRCGATAATTIRRPSHRSSEARRSRYCRRGERRAGQGEQEPMDGAPTVRAGRCLRRREGHFSRGRRRWTRRELQLHGDQVGQAMLSPTADLTGAEALPPPQGAHHMLDQMCPWISSSYQNLMMF
jgi:hypothetical protein